MGEYAGRYPAAGFKKLADYAAGGTASAYNVNAYILPVRLPGYMKSTSPAHVSVYDGVNTKRLLRFPG